MVTETVKEFVEWLKLVEFLKVVELEDFVVPVRFVVVTVVTVVVGVVVSYRIPNSEPTRGTQCRLVSAHQPYLTSPSDLRRHHNYILSYLPSRCSRPASTSSSTTYPTSYPSQTPPQSHLCVEDVGPVHAESTPFARSLWH